MKWFKHMTGMSYDPKVRRVIRKHGIEGYGVYVAVVESIANNLETASPVPDLEETAEDLADRFNYDTAKIEQIIWDCITEGLLTQDEITGRILCVKIYKFLEQSMTGNPELRKMIKTFKERVVNGDIRHESWQSHDSVMTESGQNRIEQNRKEKNIGPSAPAKKKWEDSLEGQIENLFLSGLTDTASYDFGRERKALKQLTAKCSDGLSSAKLTNIVKFFAELRKRDKFIAKQPYLPSVLNSKGIWPRVVEEFSKQPKTKKIEAKACPECGAEYYMNGCKVCGWVEQ